MNTFQSKNLLLLFTTDDNQYLNFHYSVFKKYFLNVYQFNFVEYCNQNGIRNTEKYILDFILSEKIDIIISAPFNNFHLSIDFYSKLKKNIKIIFWLFDDEFYFDVYSKYYCQIADAVITGDYFSVYAYRNLEIPAVLYFSSFSKSDYYPLAIKKDIDVSFLGDCTKNDRMEHLNYLTENGIKVETFGKGSKNGFLEWEKAPELFSRSKINLNFSKIGRLNWINNDEPLLRRVRQCKGRIVQIALTKSFCLSEYAVRTGLFFEIGKEVDIFLGKEDLLEKVKYYLLNEKLRNEIAENAYRRAIENYESEVYIPEVFKKTEGILEANHISKRENTKIFLNRPFKIKTINALTPLMFIFIKNKKIFYALELFGELFRYGISIFFIGLYGGLIRVLKAKLSKMVKPRQNFVLVQ